jgi:hypothetical protein
MSRTNPIKLKARYGKLTVRAEETIEGRRYAICDCTCGQQKLVLAQSLTSGRTRSCGAYECRVAGRHRVKVQKRYTPSGPREISLATIRQIWNRSTATKGRKSVKELATAYGVANHNTLYSALRAVRLCGGIEEYLRRVKT